MNEVITRKEETIVDGRRRLRGTLEWDYYLE